MKTFVLFLLTLGIVGTAIAATCCDEGSCCTSACCRRK